MKVLQVHNSYRSFGGEDVVVDGEAEILSRAGHEVSRFRATNPDEGMAAGKRLMVAPWNRSSHASLGEVIDEVRPDVTHVHNTWFSLSPSVITASVAHQVPVVMSLHNYRLMCVNGLLLREGGPCRLCVGNSPANGVRFRCYRDSLPASAIAALTIGLNRWKGTWEEVELFLANSEFVRDTYLSAGFSADKIALKHNFANDPGPRRTPVEASETVLFVGRLFPEKGVEFLAEVWSHMESRGLRLRVVGDGPLRRVLQTRYPGIEFVGPLDPGQVVEEMLEARALLFPSLTFETCPLSILEAFASGLPVLASDRGAMRDLVAPLGPQWLRTAADAEDWTGGLGMLHDRDQVRVGGRRAREAYEASYTPERALRRLEEAYARATN